MTMGADEPTGDGPLFDAFPTPAVVLDAGGRVTDWNAAATGLFGWQTGDVLGDVAPFVPPAEEGRWRDHLERAAGGDASSAVGFSLRSASGAKIRADVTMQPLRTGDAPRVLAAVEDRTRQVELASEVRLFDRVLRHNLRNDLNVVTGCAELLADELDDERTRSLATEIDRHARSVLAVSDTARRLHDVLGGDGEPREIQLDELVADLVGKYAAVATVTTELQPVRARAVGDVRFAIDHLLANAVEHNDTDDPRIDVRLETTVEAGQRWADLVVADNGPGIPDQERAVLTEGAETALHHGSGLGLWLVYWTVQKSNGELSYAPNTPRGSVVTLRLLAAR